MYPGDRHAFRSSGDCIPCSANWTRISGFYLSSGYEYPGRYSRWDIASVCPPLEVIGFGRDLRFRALNERGAAINRMLEPVLASHPHWDDFRLDGSDMVGRLKPLPALFPEEERSKQPSFFSVLRALIQEFQDRQGLAARSGRRVRLRPALPVRSHRASSCRARGRKTFSCSSAMTSGTWTARRNRLSGSNTNSALRTTPPSASILPPSRLALLTAGRTRRGGVRSHAGRVHGERRTRSRGYAARRLLRGGPAADLLYALFGESHRSCFERVQQASPSPYEFLLQFGDEQFIGASPEMFVRVEGSRVETCPISGTAQPHGRSAEGRRRTSASF